VRGRAGPSDALLAATVSRRDNPADAVPNEEHVASPSPIRLLTFRPTEAPSLVDRDIRAVVASGRLVGPGQRHLMVGRRGSDADAERVIVSVWDTDGSMAAWAGGPFNEIVAEQALIPTIEVRALEVLPLAVALGLVQPTEPQVLRIFRGAVRDGELNAYVDEARAGTIADIEAGHGPHALYLGVVPPTEFVTVSLWDDWDAIESATGGDVRRPVATRHADRLTRGTAQHYEVVTDISAAIPE
jgi:heme-degrading monooxygenase HmoA